MNSRQRPTDVPAAASHDRRPPASRIWEARHEATDVRRGSDRPGTDGHGLGAGAASAASPSAGPVIAPSMEPEAPLEVAWSVPAPAGTQAWGIGIDPQGRHLGHRFGWHDRRARPRWEAARDVGLARDRRGRVRLRESERPVRGHRVPTRWRVLRGRHGQRAGAAVRRRSRVRARVGYLRDGRRPVRGPRAGRHRRGGKRVRPRPRPR